MRPAGSPKGSITDGPCGGGCADQVAFRNAKGFDMKYKIVAIETR